MDKLGSNKWWQHPNYLCAKASNILYERLRQRCVVCKALKVISFRAYFVGISNCLGFVAAFISMRVCLVRF